MRAGFIATSAVAIFIAASAAAAQDSAVVVGDVVSAQNGTPLSYSTFSLGAGPRGFTNGDGSFSFRAAIGARYRIQIRQLGYAPLDTAFTVLTSGTTRMQFALRPLAYQLAAVRTEARHPCSAEIRGTELASILEQVSENAEREKLIRVSSPFQYSIERTRRSEWSGGVSRYVRDTVTLLSTTFDTYQPGKIVRPGYSMDGTTRELRIPQLSDLADSVFLGLHCFSYGGVRTIDGRKDYEIDFEPARDLKLADVRGTVFLDSTTFQIHRAEFELTRGAALSPPVTALRVTTMYRDLAPGLRFISTVQSVQDFPHERPTDPIQVQRESQRLLEVRFLADSVTSARVRPPSPRSN